MNFLLLVIDSLRADRLSCYGCERPTTPHLDAVTASGALFENFYTPVTPTQPAMTTLFTGQFPLAHRIFAQSGRNNLAEDAPWFPELLASHGYATAAIDNLALAKRWFRRGFRDYQTLADLHSGEARYLRCTDLNRAAMQWLDCRRADPFFLYLRYGDPHTPYAAPSPFAEMFYDGDPTVKNRGSLDEFYERPLKSYLIDEWLTPVARDLPGAQGIRIEDIEWCRAQYDAEVRFVDDGVAALLAHLEQRGLTANTTVIIVGDHGESLGEHGIYFEHHGLYDCTIRPPLIIRRPGAGKQRITATTQMADIAPTVLELAGINVPGAMEGRSLVPLLEGATPRETYAQVVCCEATWMCKWAFIENGHKLIIAREPDMYGKPPLELYDLQSDPAERRNLATTQPEIADAMLVRFEDWLAQQLARSGEKVDPLRAHGSVRDKLLRPLSIRQKITRGTKQWLRRARPQLLVISLVVAAIGAFLTARSNTPGGRTASLTEKLSHQWQLYDAAQDALTKRTVSRREWERMLQPTGAFRWSKHDLDQLRAGQKARIDAAAQQARAASVIDLDEVRRSGRVRDFCAALPKGGMLHVHPTGTLQPATVERLLREENPVVGRDAISYAKAFGAAELQFLRDYPGDVRYLALRPEDQARFRGLFVLPENRSDFRRFAVIFPLVGWLRQLPNVDAWQIITDDFLARAEAQRVRYAEWTMHVEPNAEALRQLQTTAARAQERYGITVRVNAAFDRATSPRDNAGKLQQLIRSLNEKPSGVLVGIDLAGDEAGQPAFEAGQPLYSQLLRDAPLHRTMHAGTGDPRNARDALLLGAERIGHGTQLLADPVVLEFAARQRVAVEANLVSNVRLRYAESFARHPFLPLVRSGVRVSLSTDDEGIFGTDITNEFATAIAHTDITYAEVRQLIINSIATSFAAPEEKDALLALVENDLREFEQSWGTSKARD